jgi:hypothetical protein
MTGHPSDRARFKAMAQDTRGGRVKIAATGVGFNRVLPTRVIGCIRHDQNALNPDHDTMPLDAFVTLVERGHRKLSVYPREHKRTAAE